MTGPAEGGGVSFEALRAFFPNRWRVRTVPGGDPRAHYIVANPKTMEGRMFAKSEWTEANEWCALKNDELARAGLLDPPTPKD